jgi:hypothetical protein
MISTIPRSQSSRSIPPQAAQAFQRRRRKSCSRNTAFDTQPPGDHNRTLPTKSDESKSQSAYDYTGVVTNAILLSFTKKCALHVDTGDVVIVPVRHHSAS